MKKTVFYLVVILLLQACNSTGTKQFNIAYPFKENENDRWGLIDANGNVLIANEWETEPTLATDGIVIVQNKNNMFEYWTAEEKTKQIGGEYIGALPFREDLAAVISKDSICEYIDKQGNVKLSLNKLDGKKVNSITSFYEGKAAFMDESNKCGYIDKTGKVVIKPVYNFVSKFSNGTAYCSINEENSDNKTIYIIDEFGKSLKEFSKEYLFNSSISNYYPFSDDNGNAWGIMDSKGDKVLRPSEKYKAIEAFGSKEFFSFSDGDKSGIINLKGEVVIRPKYNIILFCDNNFLMSDNGKYGYLNQSGEEIIKPTYEDGMLMVNKKVFVKDRNRWILIDDKGKDVLKKDFYTVSVGNDLYNILDYVKEPLTAITAPQRKLDYESLIREALKKAQLASSVDTTQNQSSNTQTNNQSYSTYTIVSEKAYFYSKADLNTRRNGYLIKNQQVQGCCNQNGFTYVQFTNDSNKTTEGWIKTEDLQ